MFGVKQSTRLRASLPNETLIERKLGFEVLLSLLHSVLCKDQNNNQSFELVIDF